MDTGLMEAFKAEGWYLSDDAIQRLSGNGTVTNLRQLLNKALDLDLREISVPFLPEEVAKGKLESVPGNVVLQLQKIRNISAPKANEDSQAAPRMLKMVFTDGSTSCHAVEVEMISNLSLNTPPGTKVLLKGDTVPMCHGVLLLRASTVQVLGGRVTALIEKWELNRSLAKHTRGRIGEEGGPPPWISFGRKIQRPIVEKNFKSLGEAAAKENAEFEAQRQGAIAEAARGGARKVFGGGTKPIVDRNVKTIMDMGYSQEQAEQVLRQTRNNVDRALQSLQKRTGGKSGNREERSGRRRGDRDEEGGSGPKPSGQVSLFAFLEDKLPVNNEKDDKENDSQGGANSFNNLSQYQRHNSSAPKGRSERNPSRSAGRGNYSGSSDSRIKEDRSRQSNSVSQNQKPPRFQNQQQRHSDSFQNWSYNSGSSEYAYEDRSSFNNPRFNKNSDNFNGDTNTFNRRTLPPPTFTNSEPSHDFGRNNRHYDMHTSNGPPPTSYKTTSSSYSRQMMEAGMPEIPEFPFKDFSSLPPLLANNTPVFFHSNQPPQLTQTEFRSSSEAPTWQWKIGDKCMAKYWEDNMYYNAEVTGISKKTCVVRFLDYGNFEEVLQDDCIPLTEEGLSHPSQYNNANSSHNSNNNHFQGVLEFRRGGTRPYIKSNDSTNRKNPRNSQPMYVPPAQRRD